MSTSPSQILAELFQNSNDVLHLQLETITQEESLLQPPFRGNCLNWVTGHILGIQGEALELMGLPGTLNPEEEKTYGYGSEPLTDPARACDLTSLVLRLDDSLARLTQALNASTPLEMEREVRIWRGPMSLLMALSFIQWHHAYHTGQLELLRQLAGKNDKII